MPEYVDRDFALRAQVRCPHRVVNRAGTECATCGSRRSRPGGPWDTFLRADWFSYYVDGGEPPTAPPTPPPPTGFPHGARICRSDLIVFVDGDGLPVAAIRNLGDDDPPT